MAEPVETEDPSVPPSPGYSALRKCHKRAYEHISKALQIDESGRGDKSQALDYYSKGVTELERGIELDVVVQGEEVAKAERLRNQMITNLEMARDRVTNLLSGGELQGRRRKAGSSSKSKAPEPTESLRFFGVTPREPLKPKTRKPPSPDKDHPALKRQNSKERSRQPERTKLTPDHLKGVDSKLAQTLLDEIVENDTSITWEDVVGLELPKRTLQEIVILPALRPELFTGLRAPARGLLLFGPPGNGKTMLAKAVAHESKATFFNISASSLTSKWVGEGEKLVRSLFALSRELQPSIIFIDEVDALLGRRSESDHDAMRRLKNEFLLQFDGMHSSEGEKILVMAATNRPQELDDAALRRFEKRIYVPLPAHEARKAVLQKLLSKHNNTISNKQLEQLARVCQGYSGSDLTALAKDAALGPIRELDYSTLKDMPANKVRPICFEDFQLSMKQIRPSVSTDLLHTLEQWNTLYGVSS